MDRQAAINRICDGMASQGFKASVGPDRLCRLRGAGGRKCHIGWLIDDADYRESMEDDNVTWLSLKDFAYTTEEDAYFLVEVQAAHDRKPLTPKAIKARLIAVIDVYGLEHPACLT